MLAKLNSRELEDAHRRLSEIEHKLCNTAADARGRFFTEIQENMLDRNPPRFDKGTTMSQAFRMGMDAGVVCVFDAVDKRGLDIYDDEVPINAVMNTEDNFADLVDHSQLWATHINS